jgi:Holliday junction DNA helicase RuvA
MIASIRGEVLSRLPGDVIVEAAGVGYRLAVSSETLSSVPSPGQQATLLTHLVMRDDAMHLYGFASEAERELFLMLIGVQSVGPKVAGKATDDIVVRRTASDDPRTLAREGLLGLGFTPQEADRLLDQSAGETPEDLIAGALRAAR